MNTPLSALLLVVGCAVAFSAVDLLRKILAQRIPAVPLLLYLSAGMIPFFAIWLLRAETSTIDRGYWLPGLASTALNVGANLAFLEALRLSPLSLTIPLLSLTPVFTTLLAIPVLGELPTWTQWMGILAVVAGILALQIPAAGAVAPSSFVSRLVRARGSLLMVGVAVLWSLAMPLDKLAVSRSSPAAHGLVLSCGVAAALLAVMLLRGRLGELTAGARHAGLLALAVALSLAALAFQLVAITLVWVGLVETLKRGLGSALAVLAGYWVFAEPIGARKIAGVALMAVGVALILI